MKARLLTLCLSVLFFACSTTPHPNDITGLWKSRDQNSNKPRSLVVIYEYHGKYYGRMLVTYDPEGKVDDTILEKKGRAPGVVGHPPYCGLDFIYNVVKEPGNNKYRGKIIDPKKGKVYNAEFWREGDTLILRGEWWIFGKNIPWHRASKKDLPKGFSMREVKKFVPVVPQVT